MMIPQLKTIAKADQEDVIACYWVMMSELRTHADNTDDKVLKHMVEGFYRLWNRVTNDHKTPDWSKQ
jgi:hypothetical protein